MNDLCNRLEQSGMGDNGMGDNGIGDNGMGDIDVEVILPINEFKVLQDAHAIRNITPEILSQTDDRYRRYILMINDWSDRNNNDYSYVKNVIYEYLGSSEFETRKRLMKYIDSEIMMMMNICQIDDMGL